MFPLENFQPKPCPRRHSLVILVFVLMISLNIFKHAESLYQHQANIDQLLQQQQQQQQSTVDIQENDIKVIERPASRHKPHKHFNESLWKFGEAASISSSCSRASEDLDRCSAQIIAFGASGMTFPQTMQELNSNYCPKIKQVTNCIKTSSECYSRFERQVINWVLTSTKRMNNKRCKNEAEKSRFVRMTNSCLSQMESPMNKCMYNYVASLDAIADSADFIGQEDFLIQLSCCANKQFKKCMMKQAKQHCKPTPDSLNKLRRTNSVSSHRMARKHFDRNMAETMNDLSDTIDGMALSGPELICNNVTDDFCRNKFDAKFTDRTPRHKSILPAIMKIYSYKPPQ